tara:strand:- start:16 stop:771 length:756 start_codon:yes stop_codon:yes gene_type:complete
MKMKYLVNFCVFFILWSIQGQAQGLFNAAAQNYKNEAYSKAIEQWNTILDNGEHSPALYYNIANAHYKLNQLGPSIFYYEKALALAPNDTQIKTNLGFAQNAKVDAIASLPKTIFSKWYSMIVGQFTFDSWAKMTVLFSCMFSLLFLAYYFVSSEQKKRLYFATAILSGCLFVLAFTLACVRYKDLQENVFAIVFSQATDVKSSPKTNSDTVFVIHEGTKVQLLETDGLWTHVAIENGIDGWLPSSDIKKL